MDNKELAPFYKTLGAYLDSVLSGIFGATMEHLGTQIDNNTLIIRTIENTEGTRNLRYSKLLPDTPLLDLSRNDFCAVMDAFKEVVDDAITQIYIMKKVQYIKNVNNIVDGSTINTLTIIGNNKEDSLEKEI